MNGRPKGHLKSSVPHGMGHGCMVEIEWWVERSGVVGFHYLTHIYTHTHTQNTYLHCKLQVLAGEDVGLRVLLHLSIGVPYTPACFGSTKPIEEQAIQRGGHFTTHQSTHTHTALHTYTLSAGIP